MNSFQIKLIVKFGSVKNSEKLTKKTARITYRSITFYSVIFLNNNRKLFSNNCIVTLLLKNEIKKKNIFKKTSSEKCVM